MGQFANEVQEYLREQLSASYPAYDWVTEHSIGGTPVDVAGHSSDEVAIIELEWRRADPADNTAKLFRHLSAEEISAQRVFVSQLFTKYYELTDGDVSSKRKNAEFVGETAADSFDHLTYRATDLDIDPPKRGGDRPGDWRETIDETANSLLDWRWG